MLWPLRSCSMSVTRSLQARCAAASKAATSRMIDCSRVCSRCARQNGGIELGRAAVCSE